MLDQPMLDAEPALEPKKWYTSKTLWFNVGVAAGAGALTAFTGESEVPLSIATVVGTIGNLILRLVTKQPVTL